MRTSSPILAAMIEIKFNFGSCLPWNVECWPQKPLAAKCMLSSVYIYQRHAFPQFPINIYTIFLYDIRNPQTTPESFN